ncbi:hypothetical protein Cycma_4531 [Cyclobacterium marinum DSM 745]|jgi:hypothetical protein|uniref:Uncharacterized protein n=1 Tax=Cyclobacterium marinum (strain ATCC 25205 / DSM 745 / LMG 13164 / NCIMB 1802) TaxID=880070 RepID=G0J0F0_CYCMS|nr:hypothetical protein Cycma_4531 [Cyclobacterium marinum DSM 745]
MLFLEKTDFLIRLVKQLAFAAFLNQVLRVGLTGTAT